MDPSVMQENRFAVFKFKVTVRAQMIKYMTVSDISVELLLFWCENVTLSFLPSLSSIAACSAEQQSHACFHFKSTSE